MQYLLHLPVNFNSSVTSDAFGRVNNTVPDTWMSISLHFSAPHPTLGCIFPCIVANNGLCVQTGNIAARMSFSVEIPQYIAFYIRGSVMVKWTARMAWMNEIAVSDEYLLLVL